VYALRWQPSAETPGLSDHLAATSCRQCVQGVCGSKFVPGPSAIPTTLVASGLPARAISIEGFLPRTGAARRESSKPLPREDRTIVCS